MAFYVLQLRSGDVLYARATGLVALSVLELRSGDVLCARAQVWWRFMC
jgi:hypothetical protein